VTEDDSPVSTSGSTLRRWTERLARPVGDPGGGAASAVMLALASALTSMVAGYTHPSGAGGRGDRDDALDVVALRERADARRERALELADVDAQSSREFGAAYHEPSGERRDRAVQTAGADAARTSDDVALLALEALDDLERLAPHAPHFLGADVGVAAAALRAAIAGARTTLAADLDELARHGGEPPAGLAADLARFDDALNRITALERP
jgi:formiminotetrahydrofolate cyclodeaminase